MHVFLLNATEKCDGVTDEGITENLDGFWDFWDAWYEDGDDHDWCPA